MVVRQRVGAAGPCARSDRRKHPLMGDALPARPPTNLRKHAVPNQDKIPVNVLDDRSGRVGYSVRLGHRRRRSALSFMVNNCVVQSSTYFIFIKCIPIETKDIQ
jgi:hypothetical protein